MERTASEALISMLKAVGYTQLSDSSRMTVYSIFAKDTGIRIEVGKEDLNNLVEVSLKKKEISFQIDLSEVYMIRQVGSHIYGYGKGSLHFKIFGNDSYERDTWRSNESFDKVDEVGE